MNRKPMKKRIGSFLKRKINGTRGAVSLLLVLVLSPLLSIALLLVESARYQDVVQLSEEIMDSSAFSTLADYDEYLDERFGLLSVSQESGINASFRDYLDKNMDLLGKSVTVNSSSASGAFPLSNTDIIKQQLLEYSEISVAAEIVTEGIDLDELLDKLNEALGLEELEKEIDALNAGVDVASEVEKLLEGITDTVTQYTNKYKPALTAYGTAYTEFQTKAEELITALSDAEDELEEDEDPSVVYDKQEVQDAVTALKTARDDYKTAATTLKTEFTSLKSSIEAIISAADSLPSKLQKFDEKSSDSSLSDQCTTSTYDWVKIVVDQITTTLDATVGADFKDKSAEEIKALGDQITKLGQLENTETEDNTWDTVITSDWDTDKIIAEYGTVSITSVSNSFDTRMNSLKTSLDQQANVDSDTSAQMGNFLDIAGELLGIAGLYDANLDSVVSTGKLHANTSMSFSSQMSVSSLTDLISAGEDFKDGITSLNIIKALGAVVKLLKAIVEFLVAIVSWVGETLFNLLSYIASGPKEWYNGLLLYGYGAYNFPNRTNYNSGKTVSGYSYDKIYQLAGGQNRAATITGTLSDLASFGNASGSDGMFKGAQSEYLLVGSTSELQNQSVTFFNLYLLRLVLDIIPIMKNAEVSSIAALAGPGAWVVKLAIILAEPMLDTIILVNGGKEFLIKQTVYLSYSGLVILQNDLVGITAISSNLQDKLKDTIEAHNGTPTEKGFLDASYTEHMLILLLLGVDQQTFMQRVQNLVQTEAAEHYKSEFTFDLDKAYTYIDSQVTYTLNPMFKIDSLTKNGLFTATSRQYTGY